MFDVRQMDIPLPDVKRGFIFNLLGSDRPLYESFDPKLVDQSEALVNQFEGMTEIPFSYDDFSNTRNNLIVSVNNLLNDSDRNFLIEFEKGKPDWNKSEYKDFQKFPSINWKLLNINKLKAANPYKLRDNIAKLEKVLYPDLGFKKKQGMRI